MQFQPPTFTTISDKLGVEKAESKPASLAVPVSEIATKSDSLPEFTATPPAMSTSNQLKSIESQARTIQAQLDANSAADSTPVVDVSTIAETPVNPPSRTDEFLANFLDSRNTDLAPEKENIRKEENVSELKAIAKADAEAVVEKDREYQKRLERIESNPNGKLRGALNQEKYELSRERSREIADLSFKASITNGNYEAARQAVGTRIADMEADLKYQSETWEKAYQFAQNDMTESEKLEAQQRFQSQQSEQGQAFQKEMALFNSQLRREEQAAAAARNAAAQRTALESQFASDQLERIEQADALAYDVDQQLSTIDSILGNKRGLGATTGELQSATLAGFFQGGKADGVGTLSRFTPLIGNIQGAIQSRQDKSNVLGDLSFLYNSAAFNEIVDLKKSGVTFGNLSEGERKAAAASANALIAQFKVDTEGNVTGIKGTESKFKKNLAVVQDAFKDRKESAYTDAYLTPEEQLQIIMHANN